MTQLAEKDPVSKLEESMLPMEQIDCKVVHRFAPNVYIKELHMPKGATAVGHEHTTTHFNNLLMGEVMIRVGDEIKGVMKAPYTFVSEPGERKAAYIIEDTIWQTIHPTNFSDVSKMTDDDKRKIALEVEEGSIIKSQAWLEYHKQIES